MNKQFLISAVVLSIMSLMLGFVVHAVLLQPDYAALPALYRSDEDAAGYLHYMMLAHLLIGVGLVWIYRQGKHPGDWLGQGLRFGCAVAVMVEIPWYLIYYAVQPLPGMLVAKQIVFSVPSVLLMGIAVAWLNRAEG